MSSTSPRKRGDLEDLTFYVLQAGRPPWDAERDMQLIRQRGGIVIDDPADATIIIIDTPAARPDRETKHRVYKYAEVLADDAPVDEWTVDLLVRRFATEDSGTIVLLSKWLQKDNAAFGPLYSGYLVRGVHVPAESEDESPEPPEPPMPDIPSDNGSDYEPAPEEKVSTPSGKGKGKQRADSDEEYSPAGARKRSNGRHKVVESPKARRGRRKKQDSSSDIEFVGSSQPQGWKRYMLSDEEDEEPEPVKRGRGRPRKVVPDADEEVAKRGPGRPRKPTFAPNPRTPRTSTSGNIFATGRYPLTFYVAPSDNDLLERLIPSAGGGDLVSASEANIIILPLAQGEAPTTREHIKLLESAHGGVARVVSEDWAWDCFRAHPPTLLDLGEYEVSLDGAASQRSVRAAPSSQRSAPSSSQRPAPASSQGKRAASSSQNTPAKRPRGSSTMFEEDHRWYSSQRTNHEMAYYEDEDIDFDGILEEHVERVELLIHYLRRWDKRGDKDDFIKSLAKTNSVRGASDIYYNKGYQHLIDRQVPGLRRAGRRASGKVFSVTATPSKAAPVSSTSTPSKAKTTRPRRDPDEINVELVKEDQKERVVELIKALREWDKTGSKSQKLKDLGREISGAMTLYYAHRDLVERQVPGL